MRAVVQRVSEGSVISQGKITGEIKKGLVVLIGVEKGDTQRDVQYIADKIVGLRIFEDEAGKMNLSVEDVSGDVLAVSQFTLLGDARKGKRPGFTDAEEPERADRLYRELVDTVKAKGIAVFEGVFRTEMTVKIFNDGPVTILLDSRKTF